MFTTDIQFEYNTIAGRIRELAFLNPEVKSLASVVCHIFRKLHFHVYFSVPNFFTTLDAGKDSHLSQNLFLVNPLIGEMI